MTAIQEQIAADLEKALAAGTLTTDALRRGIREITDRPDKTVQDLLYLQTERSSPYSKVIGMMMIENGQRHEGALDADEWPYQTVLEAMEDGWRVISFPNLALMALNHDDSHGLEFEFILER